MGQPEVTMRKVFQNPEAVPLPVGQYSQAVRIEIGDAALIFIAGQVALDAAGRLVGAGDVAAQTEQIYQNLAAILAANGATFADVVKMNTYLVDIADVLAVAEARRRYLAAEPPAGTLVAARALVRPDYLIEIEAVAAVPLERAAGDGASPAPG
jgi:2-iminobutanoate/2-iminopropanoate deaminase